MSFCSKWIERVYPAYCGALGLAWAPPFRDFARALKREMPKRRYFHEPDEHGKRKTARGYTLLDPKIVPRRTASKRPAVERGFDGTESVVEIAAASALDQT
jgi:hypothetical protein